MGLLLNVGSVDESYDDSNLSMKLSLIIPTLNERDSIAKLLPAVCSVMQTVCSSEDFEIIVVDDASSDGTAEVAESLRLQFPIRVIRRAERGLATAVLRGFSEATGDVFGVMDADLSHPPELLSQFFEKIQTNDLVLASRYMQGGVVEKWPWYRLYPSKLMTLLTRPLGVRVSDPLSGFFFVRKNVVAQNSFSPIGYKILLEILVKSSFRSFTELPYTFRNRDQGESKMDGKEAFRYLKHLARLYRWKYFSIFFYILSSSRKRGSTMSTIDDIESIGDPCFREEDGKEKRKSYDV